MKAFDENPTKWLIRKCRRTKLCANAAARKFGKYIAVTHKKFKIFIVILFLKSQAKIRHISRKISTKIRNYNRDTIFTSTCRFINIILSG